MAQQSLLTSTTSNDLVVNRGVSANDRNGDPLRTAFGKVNESMARAEANFIELYAAQAALANDILVVDGGSA